MSRSEKVKLTLIDGDGRCVDYLELFISDDGKKVGFECLSGPLIDGTYQGTDYFWLLAELRDDLFALGLRPLVKGAVNNVFPGGLAGETSLGIIAYILDSHGKGVGTVNIFDEADIGEVGRIISFEEHKKFRKSLAQNRRVRKI